MSLFTMYVVGVSVIFVRIDFGSRLPKWQMIALGVSDILCNTLFVYTYKIHSNYFLYIQI